MSRVGFSPGIRSHIRRFLISGPKYCPVSSGDRLNAAAMSLEEAVFMAAFGRFLPVVTKQRPGQITCKWFVKSVQLSRIDVHFAHLAGVPILGIGRWPFHSDGLLTNWHFNDRQRFRWPLRRS